MKTDLLNRRLRFAPPTPAVKRLVLTEGDYLLFEAINRHGPLPTHYLFEFTKHIRRNYPNLQWRLTQFYNGDSLGPYLVRPPQQFAGYEARYQHMVYDLAPRARQVLAERGTLSAHTPKRTDPFLHQLMQACVGASIELEAAGKGLRYISRAEILTHSKCPPNAGMSIPLSGFGEQKAVLPDDLFGLEYPGVGFRFFAVEIDRNTESIERKNLDQNSFGRKVAGYFDILRNQTYRAHWGLPNLSVLTVTTNGTHALNILDYVKKRNDPQYEGRFAIACEPSFGTNWRVPRTVLYQLLGEPWTTPTGQKDITQA